MKKDIPIVIKDSKEIKNIFIQVNVKSNTTSIFSSFSVWENLALILEALAVTAEKCIAEGVDKKQVYDAIKNYIVQVLPSYKVMEDSKIEVS